MKSFTLPVHVDTGSDSPVVLLHGLGNNYKSWTYVLRHLEGDTRRVVAVDLLGFGHAPKPNDVSYTPADHAEAVIATLDKLKIKNALIVGHSMGCIVAIEIAKQRPDLSHGLVLLGAPVYKTLKRASGVRRWLRLENKYFALFNLVKGMPDVMQTGGSVAEQVVPFIKGMEITDETWPAYRKSLEHTIMQTQSYVDATELRVPTLFVNGILDLFIIRRNIKQIARRNRRYIRVKTVLGPHEITPVQGKRIARLLRKQ